MCACDASPAQQAGPSTSPLAVAVNRRALTIAVVSVGALGLAALSAPFLLSLRPSERALADAVVLEVPELKPGTYQTVDGRFSRLYLLRTSMDETSVFAVPMRAGRVGMPDLHWWKPLYYCTDFRPDSVGTRLTDNAIVHCQDAQAPPWWAQRWRWTTSGSNIASPGIDALPAVRFEQMGATLHIYRWDHPW